MGVTYSRPRAAEILDFCAAALYNLMREQTEKLEFEGETIDD